MLWSITLLAGSSGQDRLLFFIVFQLHDLPKEIQLDLLTICDYMTKQFSIESVIVCEDMVKRKLFLMSDTLCNVHNHKSMLAPFTSVNNKLIMGDSL